MTVQDQYWIELYQLKVHINVVELVLEHSEKWDRNLGIFLALTSSSSIAAWVVWSECAWLWALIIMASHVVIAVRPFLRHKEIIKGYPGLMVDLALLMNEFEHKWHSIEEGELTQRQINDARFELRKQKYIILKKHISTSIPGTDKQHQAAEESARQYFVAFFPTAVGDSYEQTTESPEPSA